ncbi:MAG: hypothetical protein WCI57_01490 [Candidatus Berkelbacteria bacterium]
MTRKTLMIMVIFLVFVGVVSFILIEKDKKEIQVKTSSEKSFNEQIAVKTAKTWKVLNRDISNIDSYTIYEYVIGSEDERLVVRKRLHFYETMDILPSDTVKISLKADYKSDYGSGLTNNPYLYDIERVKNE